MHQHFCTSSPIGVDMASQMFCEMAGLNAAALSAAGGDRGIVHRVTVGVADSNSYEFVGDAPAGCWVVVRTAEVGAVLPNAEVLLVAVQAADTMWLLRAVTRKTFQKAVEVETRDKRENGTMEQAVMLAAALIPSSIVRMMPDKPPSGITLKLEHMIVDD
jgi:hypothetical protein